MPPRTRTEIPPNFVIEEEVDEDPQQCYSDDEASVFGGFEGYGFEYEQEEIFMDYEIVEDIKKKEKTPIIIPLVNVCKACKKPGHQAGFQGATYIDCPLKPCFLCKLPGHTTMFCPHRVSMEHGVIPPRRSTQHSVNYIFERQLRPHVPAIKPEYLIPDKVTRGIIRHHRKRVTCLEFHPTNNNVLLSGDKKGQLGVWDFVKLSEKTVYGNIHFKLLNRLAPLTMEASSDGTASCTDLETGISKSMVNLNPDGWQTKKWKMLYGLDIHSEKGLILVSDNFGFLYMLDARTKKQIGEAVLIHKKGTKVVGLHCNPVQPDVLLSCGNDHYARLWDIRRLEAGSSFADLSHGRVVNSAYFSPHTGSKILTTAQDNRIRVWDSIYCKSPSREIVHSHDFNRHITSFRAEWDPKDTSECLAVIGRYISENYNGIALHPIDFIDVSTGRVVAEVINPNITTITPVNKLHPKDDVLASGSWRSLYIWRPKDKSKAVQSEERRTITTCGKGDDSDDSDDE